MKARILFGLNFLIAIFLILSVISFYQLKDAETARLDDEAIESIQLDFFRLFTLDNYFFEHEEVNSRYYRTGESAILQERNELNAILNRNLSDILAKQPTGSLGLDSVKLLAEIYNARYERLVNLIKERGFKDEGIIGQMRQSAHMIEEKRVISLEDYLLLRRHEKDFLLRIDLIYVRMFNDKINELIESQRGEGADLLKDYQKQFNRLADNTRAIGEFGSSGLKFEFRDYQLQLERKLRLVNSASEENAVFKIRNGRYVFLFGVAVTLLFVLMLIVFTYQSSKKIN